LFFTLPSTTSFESNNEEKFAALKEPIHSGTTSVANFTHTHTHTVHVDHLLSIVGHSLVTTLLVEQQTERNIGSVMKEAQTASGHDHTIPVEIIELNLRTSVRGFERVSCRSHSSIADGASRMNEVLDTEPDLQS
jgi:hypothetical protein